MATIERTDIRWHVGLAVGALCVSASAVLLGPADTTLASATTARSLMDLPVVVVLAAFERRRNGDRVPREYLSAALCYSGLLFLLRRGGRGGRPVQTYAAVLTAATVVAVPVGSASRSLDVAPGWRSAGWLILVTITG